MFSIILINCFTILSSFWVLSQGFELNECYSKPETGLCKALFLRYYYDKQTNKCQKFNYGGCGGNGNRFFTEDECIRTCSLKQVQRNNSLNLKNVKKGVLLNKCWLKPEKGFCNALSKRFYFDQNTRSCQLFNYGGCGGNANNFVTLNQCHDSCKIFG